MSDDLKILAVHRVVDAAKKWTKQRIKTLRAAHLGKARSRTALHDRAVELATAVEALDALTEINDKEV